MNQNRMRIVSESDAAALHGIIVGSSVITVVSHTHPDGDAVGSCLAFRSFLRQQGKDAETFQAFTNVLLLNADGKKMGKTEKGALWVDKDKCSPYDFYQYFYNCDDRDVEKLLKLITYLPLDEIKT